MHSARAFPALLALSIAVAFPLRAAEPSPVDERAVENLAVFARVYGYVRFFHPSDAAAAADWDKVAIAGVAAVRDAEDIGKLRDALLDVFGPLAPTMELSSTPRAPDATAPGGRLTFWQHRGVNFSSRPGIYCQQRVITGETSGERAPLFTPANPPPAVQTTLAAGLALYLPLALPVDAQNKTADGDPAKLAALQARLAGLDGKALSAADWRVRAAGVAIVWGTFQHFHPYLDGIGAHWDDELRPALRRALRDPDGSDYRDTIAELVAKSRDGHGWVYGPPVPIGELPLHVALVEGRVVVTGFAAGAPLRKGDIVERLDGALALDVLHDRERHTPGSPHLSEFRALNEFGEGAPDTIARLDLQRDGATEKIEVSRIRTPGRRYFFHPIGEFDFPSFAEVRPGVYYVNLPTLELPEFEAKLPLLADARGVIFDNRYDGRKQLTSQVKQIHQANDVIPHLIDQRIQASPMLTPQVSRPDRVGWTYKEDTWPVSPKMPRLKGRIVFINDPAVVSYGETCMAMIADFHLATLIGAPTAGTNGNVNFIALPGEFHVMWTGMDVRKHDRSPFYTTGFAPDFPVARTLRAVAEGRDEYLEKAIEVIEQSTPPAGSAAPKKT